jgi:hypothetical protein
MLQRERRDLVYSRLAIADPRQSTPKPLRLPLIFGSNRDLAGRVTNRTISQ